MTPLKFEITPPVVVESSLPAPAVEVVTPPTATTGSWPDYRAYLGITDHRTEDSEYRLDQWEVEGDGWSRIEDCLYAPSRKAAHAYADAYNNAFPPDGSWYMYYKAVSLY